MYQFILYQNCFPLTKTLRIPQNLGNQIVLKVLNVTYIFDLHLFNIYAVMKVRSLLTEMCNINP